MEKSEVCKEYPAAFFVDLEDFCPCAKNIFHWGTICWWQTFTRKLKLAVVPDLTCQRHYWISGWIACVAYSNDNSLSSSLCKEKILLLGAIRLFETLAAMRQISGLFYSLFLALMAVVSFQGLWVAILFWTTTGALVMHCDPLYLLWDNWERQDLKYSGRDACCHLRAYIRKATVSLSGVCVSCTDMMQSKNVFLF